MDTDNTYFYKITTNMYVCALFLHVWMWKIKIMTPRFLPFSTIHSIKATQKENETHKKSVKHCYVKERKFPLSLDVYVSFCGRMA